MAQGAMTANKYIREYVIPLLLIIVFAYLTYLTGIIMPLAVIGASCAAMLFYYIAVDARVGFKFLIIISFLNNGLNRYVNAPLGLMIDFFLLLIFILYFFKHYENIDWSKLKNPVFMLVSVWMIINILELGNPESKSHEAWFYAMRGTSLYFFLTLLIAYLILDISDRKWFLNYWFALSIMALFWGVKQHYIGLDSAEKRWLAEPGNLSTHLLFGRLRIFSFYSDAGQFGASQAHTALVSAIIATGEKQRLRKILLFVISLLSFWGMLMSGTRGALAIPLIGFITYLALVKNWRLIIVMGSILSACFFFLKFTFVLQGVYEIRRLRTALNPNDASLQVRIANQKRLGVYLSHHLLGGGVGSAGYWGTRFTPGTFLASLALDSWYVRIAAEYGYIGLVLYILMLLAIMLVGFLNLNRIKDVEEKNIYMALYAGLSGILVASYGNQVFGQFPTGILVYLSIFFLTVTYKSTSKANALA